MTQNRAVERRQRILDAALEVFSERGFRDAAVDDVARASSTSKGGVYFHFPGKEALFLALLDRTAARLRDKIERAMDDQPNAVARADAALDAVVQTFSRHRALARLFMVESLGAGRAFHHRMAEVRAEFAAVVTDQLERAVELGEIGPVDAAVAGHAWFGAVNEVITQWVLAGDPASLDDAHEALRPLLHRSIGL